MTARSKSELDMVGDIVVDLVRDEIERLRAWKAEATTVINQWEAVWEAAGRPGRLGESKAEATRVHVAMTEAELRNIARRNCELRQRLGMRDPLHEAAAIADAEYDSHDEGPA